MKPLICVVLVMAFVFAGCVTIQHPDGTVTRRADLETVNFAVQIAMTYGPEAYQIGLELYDAMLEREVAKEQARQEAAQARIDMYLNLLDTIAPVIGFERGVPEAGEIVENVWKNSKQ